MPINLLRESLLKLPRPVKQSILIFCDILICLFSVWFSFGLRLDQWNYFNDQQWIAYIAAIGLSLPIFILFGLYKAILRFIGSSAISFIARIFFVYTSLFFCLVTLIGLNDVPRSIGVIQPIVLFVGISAYRYFARHWLSYSNHISKAFHRYQPIGLIYGAGSAGRQLAIALSSNNEMKIKGFIDDDPNLQGKTINGLFVYPNINLPELIYKLDITDLLLAIPSVREEQRSKIISSLDGCGVRVRTIPRLFDLASGRVRVSDLHDLDMNDLLGRPVVPPDIELLRKNIYNHVVLVTGAGGSIGGELCRQIIKFSPKSLVLIDNNEHSLYLIYEELKIVLAELDRECLPENKAIAVNNSLDIVPKCELVPCLASVRDKELLLKIFKTHRPFIVYHAAAYKHVPLVEQNVVEGIKNNVWGTLACAEVSEELGVNQFILVSTDKAVRPTNIMGTSKRIAEMILQAKANLAAKNNMRTIFLMVRFGNVLGSSGSVAPLFSSQINAGGPITVTHPDVTRYFMTIPEAAQLVLQAGAMSIGGDVFVLDMGEPVRIYDLAVKMVYLSGLLVRDKANPHGDIEIKITGLRPGEKLYEELLIGNSPQPTLHPKIMRANEEFMPWDVLEKELCKLNLALDKCDSELIKSVLIKLVPSYKSSNDVKN